MMTTNLFVIANVKKLRTGGSFRILLPFFRTSWGVGVLNSAIFNSFHSRVEFGTILEGLRNFEGGGFEPPHQTPPFGTPLLPNGGDHTETCWSCFNVNFNTAFKAILLCVSRLEQTLTVCCDLCRFTVHSTVYVINTSTDAHIFI
jgi:hypothetical protein